MVPREFQKQREAVAPSVVSQKVVSGTKAKFSSANVCANTQSKQEQHKEWECSFFPPALSTCVTILFALKRQLLIEIY